jgi:DNA-binding protein HU-beta
MMQPGDDEGAVSAVYQHPGGCMSKAVIAKTIQASAALSAAVATRTADELIDAIVKELKKTGRFSLVGFGTLEVRKTKPRKARNPRTGEAVKVKAGKTVRFKVSPVLRKSV